MQRRTLLSSLTTVGTVTIAGCSNTSAPASAPESTETEENPQEPFVAYTDAETPPLSVLPQVRNPTDEIVERKLWIQLVSEEGEPLARRSKIVELVPTSNGLAAAIPFSFTEVEFSLGDIDIDSIKTVLTATDAESPGEMEQTGVEPTARPNGVVGGQAVGEAAADSEKLGILQVKFRLDYMSDPINLNKMMYTFATQTKATSINGNSNDTNGLSYSQNQSLENDTTILSERDDRMIAEFDLTNISGVTPMGERTELILVLRSPGGSTHREYLQAPRSINPGSAYFINERRFES